jgi:DNA sulfur modification protein DndC
MEEKKINIVSNYQKSSFDVNGIDTEVENIKADIKRLYLSDALPWVIGYSGGKDSTACLQLIWYAIKELEESQRSKPIYVISTDTLVENPVVAMWVEVSLEKMRLEAIQQKMPFEPRRLTPDIGDRFWVNLIGKGYPAPRPMFRWCTSRLKINPSNNFILDVVAKNGEAILVLGTRKAESITRKRVMEGYEGSTRELLSRNGNPKLDRVWIYPPIVSWTNDDVWEYLVTYKNPWGYENNQLLNMYRGATQDNECPLVVDTSTPSCGDSRFGCFVCTLVDKDKSMQAMIKNDEEKKWMTPLSHFRDNFLDIGVTDFDKRDFRRMDGRLTLMDDKDTGGKKLVHGPYLQSYREKLLHELLLAQEKVRASGSEGTENFQLISDEDLEEIRRIWVKDKNEIEDRVPEIYKEATGRDYPFDNVDEGALFNRDDIALLKSIASKENSADDLHYQLVRNLLNIERNYSTATRRVGIYENLEKALINGGFANKDEAYQFALKKSQTTTDDEEQVKNMMESSAIYETSDLFPIDESEGKA